MYSFTILHRLVLASALVIGPATVCANTLNEEATTQIERTTGMKGKLNKDENVFKVSKPRTDIKVTVDKWPMAPFMGLTSWATFTPEYEPKMAIVMGDMVVFEDEVNPAMSAALDAGLEVTALHNHFFYDQPKVYFMHIGGRGSLNDLASGVKQVQDKIVEVRKVQPTPASQFPGTIAQESKITSAPLEGILGTKGETENGMFKVTIGRQAKMHGIKIGKDMGVNTWAAFAGTDEQAVVDGDFAVQEKELQPVLKALRAGGINIVAIHQHMTHEQPRYIFLHYWGKGRAQELAKVVKKALDDQAAVR
jgi:hypothetical protein